eukprot:3933871-Rhodomonas_salina.1
MAVSLRNWITASSSKGGVDPAPDPKVIGGGTGGEGLEVHSVVVGEWEVYMGLTRAVQIEPVWPGTANRASIDR